MTQEEKAKAYDEALKRARQIKNGEGDWRYSDLIEIGPALTEIFPQLAESEDERIREFLIDLLSQGTWKKDWPFSPAECVAWLEKQKENPKSADFIPADCISDAKCEDRWHKVSDSLPDNPREVLCKDEAGNYFIGRYYVGEGWDISNYDDEDKPHHLNPPVSKWIDFPSEKQKEQKPKEWSERDEEMLEYVIDDVNDAKQLFATKDAIELCDKEIAWLKSLRPHWKPSEEQIYSLGTVVKGYNECTVGSVGYNLKELYDNLKTLM